MEICYDNAWGLVSDRLWEIEDARVVCAQLGYKGITVLKWSNEL